MKTNKNESPGQQSESQKYQEDIWASAFDAGQCVGAIPPPYQSKAASSTAENSNDHFPYKGHVKEDAWSSGFYSAPDKGSKTHDLPKWTGLDVLGRTGGWLKVKILDGKAEGLIGFISQERVAQGLISHADKPQAGTILDHKSNNGKNFDDPNALFYAQVGGRLIVMPASTVKNSGQKGGPSHQQILHAFQDRGSQVTVVYVTHAGDPTFDPIKWYSDASNGGTIDIWSKMLKVQGNAGVEASAGVVSAGVTPKPWNPGNQPPGYYIGNDAHNEIAEYYRTMHLGQRVFTNQVPILSMLDAFERKGYKVNRAAATSKELSDKPDITNVSLDNLYEIKPFSDAVGAAAKLTYYEQIFLKIGIPMRPGPSADPGAIGTLPSPGGLINFMSPAPGIILYQRQQPPKQKVPVTSPVPVSQPIIKPNQKPHSLPSYQPSSDSIWDWKYWEEVTGLTGAALLIYLIISEGSRLFPPRNLLPIP